MAANRRDNNSNKAFRLLSVLRHIPRQPRSITAAELQARLDAEGHEVDRRSIERYLRELSESHDYGGLLHCNDRARPYGWSFDKSGGLDIPGMDAGTAITWELVGRHLQTLLPRASLEKIAPQVAQARDWLKIHRPPGRKSWPDKVASVPRAFPLLPAEPKRAVQEAIYEALYEERQISAVYKGGEYILHPVGLIDRGYISYLMAMAWDTPHPFMYALHRFDKAEKLDKPARKAKGFDLEEYVRQGNVDIAMGEPVNLKLRFFHDAGEHLRETPLADDQTIKDEDKEKGIMQVRARVVPSEALRWWLQGFGANVEVLSPKWLRREIGDALTEAAARYQR
jgi:predicted DNA-binding transcriptional regulator YafY